SSGWERPTTAASPPSATTPRRPATPPSPRSAPASSAPGWRATPSAGRGRPRGVAPTFCLPAGRHAGENKEDSHEDRLLPTAFRRTTDGCEWPRQGGLCRGGPRQAPGDLGPHLARDGGQDAGGRGDAAERGSGDQARAG